MGDLSEAAQQGSIHSKLFLLQRDVSEKNARLEAEQRAVEDAANTIASLHSRIDSLEGQLAEQTRAAEHDRQHASLLQASMTDTDALKRLHDERLLQAANDVATLEDANSRLSHENQVLARQLEELDRGSKRVQEALNRQLEARVLEVSQLMLINDAHSRNVNESTQLLHAQRIKHSDMVERLMADLEKQKHRADSAAEAATAAAEEATVLREQAGAIARSRDELAARLQHKADELSASDHAMSFFEGELQAARGSTSPERALQHQVRELKVRNAELNVQVTAEVQHREVLAGQLAQAEEAVRELRAALSGGPGASGSLSPPVEAVGNLEGIERDLHRLHSTAGRSPVPGVGATPERMSPGGHSFASPGTPVCAGPLGPPLGSHSLRPSPGPPREMSVPPSPAGSEAELCRKEVSEAKANVQAKIQALRGSIATLHSSR